MERIRNIIRSEFDRSIEESGFVDPRTTSERISSISGVSSEIGKDIERIIFESPTSEFLYPDVAEFFHTVLEHPRSRIDIWTDDYLQRVASSGLGEVRKVLSGDKRRRFGIRSDRSNKQLVLSEIFSLAKEKNTCVVLIDDTQKNLEDANKLVSEMGITDLVTLVHLRRSGVKSQNGFLHVPTLRDLHDMTEAESHYLIDFNGVCIDDAAYRQEREEIVYSYLSKHFE